MNVAMTVYGLPDASRFVMDAVVACPLLSVVENGLPVMGALVESFTSKVTLVPLAGVPEPGETAVIVAVKVTPCPVTEGLLDEDTMVVVAAGLTVWVVVGAVPGAL